MLPEFLLTQAAKGCRKDILSMWVSFLWAERPASSVVMCRELAQVLVRMLEHWRAVQLLLGHRAALSSFSAGLAWWAFT